MPSLGSCSAQSRVAHAYDALSYTWGSVADSNPTIFVNGHERAVTANLCAALWHLRDPSGERTLWIDALCINQQNNQEKGQQVQSMAKIYAKASRVIVWLGEPTVDSDLAFNALLSFVRQLDEEGQSPRPTTTANDAPESGLLEPLA
ncbi:heterokaryon incompatibility protein-domain-containing protein [Lasiosphaeria hispida]|uniref:Heterokaryon incompatibility protein-domain-containing protein n=1 Tax=Lasiosphaeria hispida TaxID=260671 RepID=A0AAJ0H5A3_9PEZI|nr:heterokaryon incompatibility protein-domain-containing protein [Lasiosphaeria hispida]